MQRRTVQEIQARRMASNRARKISSILFSGASIPVAVILYFDDATLFAQMVAGMTCLIVAELIDINVALRGGD